MQELRVTNIRNETIEDRHFLSADFVLGRHVKTVWFRTFANISGVADPFLPVALIPAMRRNWALTIDGEVSSRLREGADAIQQIITGWYSNFHRVPIRVSGQARQRSSDPQRVAVFFSGGVDSFYTLQQHRDEIRDLVFVHGFDVPLRFIRERERIAASVRDLAENEGLSLIEVETNLRQFGQPHVNWQYAYYGAALASVALLLEGSFGQVLIASGNAATQLRPAGSHPDMDPKWSNGVVEIVHDGLSATRFDKVQSIVEWPAVLSHLRVCYQRSDRALNCGRCRKCLWTMMLLRTLGCLDRTTTFAVPLDRKALKLYPPTSLNEIDRFKEAIALLDSRGTDPEFRATLQAMLESQGNLSLRGRVERLLARGRNYLAHRIA